VKTSPLKKIKMLVLDVDGVLTDGKIIISDTGHEIKEFNCHDGAGIRYLLRAGLRAAIITGRKCRAISIRAKDLGIEDIYQNAHDKLEAYDHLLEKRNLTDDEICVVGDDLTDLPMMARCGFPVAVANARPEVKKAAAYVTRARGGDGAVREVIEKILKAQHKWQLIMKRYEVTRRRQP